MKIFGVRNDEVRKKRLPVSIAKFDSKHRFNLTGFVIEESKVKYRY